METGSLSSNKQMNFHQTLCIAYCLIHSLKFVSVNKYGLANDHNLYFCILQVKWSKSFLIFFKRDLLREKWNAAFII